MKAKNDNGDIIVRQVSVYKLIPHPQQVTTHLISDKNFSALKAGLDCSVMGLPVWNEKAGPIFFQKRKNLINKEVRNG